MAKTLYQKLWDAHLISEDAEGFSLIYVDRQMLHDVSSPQAFAMLADRGLPLRRPASQLAVADHAVPTRGRDQLAAHDAAHSQMRLLSQNAASSRVTYIALDDPRHGIVHVIGPELGMTQPGMTIVCGDSHTSTHGAFGALAFGIGSSEVGCVLATQTLRMRRSRTLRIRIDGELQKGVTAKDVILHVIGMLGTGGGAGYVIEYCGATVDNMSMAARMTLCNMSIEAGSRAGLIAPDQTTFSWLEGRAQSPIGPLWHAAVDYWRTLRSDPDALFDRELAFDASVIAPHLTWGTSPDQVLSVDALVPSPETMEEKDRARALKALAYMGLAPGTALNSIEIDQVFIGSCTNGRIEDLREAASVFSGRQVAPRVRALIVPGSAQVKQQAEREGLAKIFMDAGAQWDDAGCSLCVAMNGDRVPAGARCASTSNRNFEGRQGSGARTHLMSPAMAAAAAVFGRITDIRQLEV